ncbi:hypothetical protein LQV05_006410 [Cryptococcus neoformans]|nr:hypothetical protein LQV05_006410 [Cryptococcus neoformans]
MIDLVKLLIAIMKNDRQSSLLQCLDGAGRLAMFYIAVYDSITELFKQALLVHHVMVLDPLGSLTTTEAIEDLVREGRIPAAGTSDGHEDFAYAANVFQDLREAIPFFDRLLVWLREVKLDDDVEMEKGEFMKQRGISISLVGSSNRSSDSTNINGNMGNLLLDHKLPDGTSANLVDPRNSRVLNGGYKSTVYAGLNAPSEHRRLWIEDPEGYRARFLARDPQLPDVVGLLGYLFPWDLFLDSENAEGAIESIFYSPVLMRAALGRSWGWGRFEPGEKVDGWQEACPALATYIICSQFGDTLFVQYPNRGTIGQGHRRVNDSTL